MSQYQRDLAEVGEHGIVMVEIPENPVKMLHWMMGPEQASLALFDHVDACRELFASHTEMTLTFVDGVCEHTSYDDTPLLMSNDNLDAALMPPAFFDRYLVDHYRRVAERIHDHGRLFAVHSCGNNWDLRHQIRDSQIDMMEGLTPPPLGNFPLDRARTEIGDHFIVEGGNNYLHQEMTEGAWEAIDVYTKQLLEQMRGTPRYIYASSCQTSPNTPIDNLHYFRDAVWRYGRR
jgi:uroporphyrinogen-III decarboxylase